MSEERREEEVTVHLLWHGRALCRFSLEVPGRWPKGHKWVGLFDAEAKMVVNCPACQRILARAQ